MIRLILALLRTIRCRKAECYYYSSNLPYRWNTLYL